MPANKVKDFEAALHEALDTKYQDFVLLFNKKMEMTDEVKSALDQIIKTIKENFK
jgi:F0F1-type ATP synthase alpha subunit